MYKPPPVPPPPKKTYKIPSPHPIRMNEKRAEVVSYKIHNRPLTEVYEVPLEARIALFPYYEPPENSKSIDIAIVGAPNAGKSTLINKILGAEIFATSRKVNTTTDAKEGIKTIDNVQMVFHDTPGIISTHGVRTNKISTLGWDAVSESDLTLFLVDAVKVLRDDIKAAASRLQRLLQKRSQDIEIPELRLIDESEDAYQERKSQILKTIPAYLVFTKVDLVQDRRRVKYIENELREYARFDKTFYISTKENYNIDTLVKDIMQSAEPGDWKFHPMQLTTLSDIEKVNQVFRTEILDMYHDKLPYIWYTRVIGWTPYLDGSLRIDVELMVHSNIQIGMAVGKKARCIKKLHFNVKCRLEKLYQRPIQLTLKVKKMKDQISWAIRHNREVNLLHPKLQVNDEIPKKTLKFLENPANEY